MSARSYREVLWPTWWIWLIALGFVGMLAVAFGAALGSEVGWSLAFAGAAIALISLIGFSPRISVSDEGIQVGHATLPREAIGRVKALTAAETKAARTEHYDASWYAVLRPSCAPTAVVIEVVDARDPHPAWIVTSRRPTKLAAALDSPHA